MATNTKGELTIFFGPMFSGKSTELIRQLTTAADIGLKTLYINHTFDDRTVESTDGIVTTHNSGFSKLSKKIDFIKTSDLSTINVLPYNVIGIDEGQFFVGLANIIRKWFYHLNKRIIIASLDGNFLMLPFGEVNQLISMCEPNNIHKLHAYCMKCLPNIVKAGYTLKYNSVYTNDPNKPDVGGIDKYAAVCIDCYKNFNKHALPF